MNANVSQPKWKVVEYSRNQIINAGKAIRKTDITDAELIIVRKVIDNWRAAHAFPLHIIYTHLRRMVKNKKDIVVAERLKRLESIVNKLKREPNMNLWTMQDLGGCRMIVPTVDDVYSFAKDYEGSRKRHLKKKEYDYIASPKRSGYRSLHVVYEYKSDRNNNYNKNMLIEVQFRTRLQHLWATAVETMGLFTHEAIKSGQGSEDVTRFFVLISTLFAIRESQPIVPGTVDDIDELVSEIMLLNARHRYLDFLRGIRVAIVRQEQKKSSSKNGYCILILNYDTRRLNIKLYKTSEFDEANSVYNLIEKTRGEAKIDAVLVQVSSFNMLRSAYPNYFSDIEEFVNIVEEYLK